jgi:hypothetical protein
MPLNQVEHILWRRPCQRRHASAQVRTEVALDGVRIMFQARINLPAVAAGCPPAGLFGLEQYHVRPFLREMQSRRQSGEATTHDGYIGARISIQRRRSRGGFSSVSVKIRHGYFCVLA